MRPRVAILDDYAGAALTLADWGAVRERAEVTVFERHLGEDEAAEVLRPYQVICTLRERTAFPGTLTARLPELKLLTVVGRNLANVDVAAAAARGVLVSCTDFAAPEFRTPEMAAGVSELAWALIMASVRNLAAEDRRIRAGGWQHTVGSVLAGRTIGILGLGASGRRVAEFARVFGMEVLAWSQNLTDEAAAAAGATRVSKAELLARADVVSVHLRLSERTRGLLAADDLALMKPSAHLVNISRGPIVDEAALVEALSSGRIAGAGLDVYDVEPLPADHPLRTLPTVTLSPHVGYATREMLAAIYADAAELVTAWLDGTPIRLIG